ncbi:MAG: M56 family metallopeptidase [Actinobacteria bacterium]|nr:M56 family metallopeptidase [Actinomycetota bacterium]
MGVLLSVPTESITIRVIVASVAAALLGRLLLRVGLRTPGIRAATALVPAAALIAVVGLTWSSLELPFLMLPVDAADALPVPIRDSYLHFAPLAAPIIVSAWTLIAGVRIVLRIGRGRRTRRSLVGPGRGRPTVRVQRIADQVARRMRVPTPPVALVVGCPGGASAVGIRRPVIVLDRSLAARMDDEELEGVLAHELAHLRRRDNLVALLLGIVRDVFFFVPGGRWALRQLHTERELAADQCAVRITHRPGALASGLLKVIDASRPDAACAAFVPSGTLVGRVQHLVEERPVVTRTRGGVELIAVATALSVAVGAAMEVPAMIAGAAGDRDAVAVVWTSVVEPTVAPETEVEHRTFQVYRRSQLETTPAVRTTPVPVVDDDPAEVSRAALAACATPGAVCPEADTRRSLPIQPRPTIRVDDDLVGQWSVSSPVVSSATNGLGVYFMQRRPAEDRVR